MIDNTKVLFKKLREDAIVPKYMTPDAVSADLSTPEAFSIGSGEIKLIKLGFSMSFSPGIEALITPRSGLAVKHGITVLNSPGTIDSGYRGEVGVILVNHGKESVHVKVGGRIAQMKFVPVVKGYYIEVSELDTTVRGEGGFGSTGI